MRNKRLLIKILAILFRSLSRGANLFFRRLRFTKAIFSYCERIFLRFFILPFYRLFYNLKYKALRIYTPAKSRFFYFLNKAYFIHIFVILLTGGVLINNISAEELRQDNFGEKTVVYAIITKEEYEELTEEGGLVSPQNKVLSYLDRTATVESQKVAIDKPTENEQVITDISTITAGGGAVVKPNIIQPISEEEVTTLVDASFSGGRGEIIKYTVLPGDTISSIAQKFKVSQQTILWQNNLSSRGFIKPGDVLEVLPVSGIVHRVNPRDTISAIGKKYQVSVDQIISYNNLKNDGSDIKIGQRLIIPGGIGTMAQQRAKTITSTPPLASVKKLFIPPSQVVSGVGFLWPTSVRRISQYYSWRHQGLDIAGPVGTPLYAAEDGVVEISGWGKGYGNTILINHGNGMKTRYGHASKLFVEKGDKVVKGQTIAAMGSTGWSTGPHIHFEVISSGSKKNPLSYIK